MALTIVGIQGARQPLGLGLEQDAYLIVPGTSDYVTGGYSITPAMLAGFGHIQNMWIAGANATAIATWAMVPVFTFAQIGAVATGSGFTGYTTGMTLYAYVLSTGAQASSGANLTGAVWSLVVQGY
jgi:hypothetical protein